MGVGEKGNCMYFRNRRHMHVQQLIPCNSIVPMHAIIKIGGLH